MCGIAAVVSLNKIDHELMCSMLNTIKHRGPDGSGIESFYNKSSNTFLSLGHVRLSIIDLSEAGHQPMKYEERYWLSYNGELYNHDKLRKELKDKGYCFCSHTDTEVILAAYAEWGQECLHKFNGMFSFVLYDSRESELFVVRDRFGIKPLYYWISPTGEIAFASEIKQFTSMDGWLAKLNPQRAYDFLNWGVNDHTNECLFENVYQFRPGEALHISIKELIKNTSINQSGQLDLYCWYKLKEQPFEGNYESATNKFKSLLTDSVKLHLKADVPIGSCLSGGLDSSSIVMLVNNLLELKDKDLQKTFSACSVIERFDEKKWIDIVVKASQVSSHYIYPALENLFDDLDTITWHQDEPFASTSIFAQWSVFKAAADCNVKVMLDGQGADELLAGYSAFFGPMLAGLFYKLKWIRLIDEVRQLKKQHNQSIKRSIEMLFGAILPFYIGEFIRKKTGRSYDAPDWINMEDFNIKPREPFLIQENRARSVKDMSYSQLVSTNLQMLLHWEDRDSMAHSIEARVPFLDYRLVEQVLGFPEEYKISDAITKRVLRDGMKGILPEAIANRMDKMGFQTPEEVWMREEQPEMFKQKIREAIGCSKGFLNEKTIRIADEIIDGDRPFSYLPWRIISFGNWMKCFSVQV